MDVVTAYNIDLTEEMNNLNEECIKEKVGSKNITSEVPCKRVLGRTEGKCFISMRPQCQTEVCF